MDQLLQKGNYLEGHEDEGRGVQKLHDITRALNAGSPYGNMWGMQVHMGMTPLCAGTQEVRSLSGAIYAVESVCLMPVLRTLLKF